MSRFDQNFRSTNVIDPTVGIRQTIAQQQQILGQWQNRQAVNKQNAIQNSRAAAKDKMANTLFEQQQEKYNEDKRVASVISDLAATDGYSGDDLYNKSQPMLNKLMANAPTDNLKATEDYWNRVGDISANAGNDLTFQFINREEDASNVKARALRNLVTQGVPLDKATTTADLIANQYATKGLSDAEKIQYKQGLKNNAFRAKTMATAVEKANKLTTASNGRSGDTKKWKKGPSSELTDSQNYYTLNAIDTLTKDTSGFTNLGTADELTEVYAKIQELVGNEVFKKNRVTNQELVDAIYRGMESKITTGFDIANSSKILQIIKDQRKSRATNPKRHVKTGDKGNTQQHAYAPDITNKISNILTTKDINDTALNVAYNKVPGYSMDNTAEYDNFTKFLQANPKTAVVNINGANDQSKIHTVVENTTGGTTGSLPKDKAPGKTKKSSVDSTTGVNIVTDVKTSAEDTQQALTSARAALAKLNSADFASMNETERSAALTSREQAIEAIKRLTTPGTKVSNTPYTRDRITQKDFNAGIKGSSDNLGIFNPGTSKDKLDVLNLIKRRTGSNQPTTDDIKKLRDGFKDGSSEYNVIDSVYDEIMMTRSDKNGEAYRAMKAHEQSVNAGLLAGGAVGASALAAGVGITASIVAGFYKAYKYAKKFKSSKAARRAKKEYRDAVNAMEKQDVLITPPNSSSTAANVFGNNAKGLEILNKLADNAKVAWKAAKKSKASKEEIAKLKKIYERAQAELTQAGI